MIEKKKKQLQQKRDEYLSKIQKKTQLTYEKRLEKYSREQNRKLEKLKRQIE
jgi:hypothetical protein